MMNGQVKPAYNVQLAVHREYILGIGVYPYPADTRMLIPFLSKLETRHGKHYDTRCGKEKGTVAEVRLKTSFRYNALFKHLTQ